MATAILLNQASHPHKPIDWIGDTILNVVSNPGCPRAHQSPLLTVSESEWCWEYLGCGYCMCKNSSSRHSPPCLVTGYLHIAFCHFKQHYLVPVMTGLKKPCIIWCQTRSFWRSFGYHVCMLTSNISIVASLLTMRLKLQQCWIFIHIPSCLYRSSPHVHIPFQHSNLKMYVGSGSFEVPAFIYAGWPAWSPT